MRRPHEEKRTSKKSQRRGPSPRNGACEKGRRQRDVTTKRQAVILSQHKVGREMTAEKGQSLRGTQGARCRGGGKDSLPGSSSPRGWTIESGRGKEGLLKKAGLEPKGREWMGRGASRSCAREEALPPRRGYHRRGLRSRLRGGGGPGAGGGGGLEICPPARRRPPISSGTLSAHVRVAFPHASTRSRKGDADELQTDRSLPPHSERKHCDSAS